MSAGRFAFDIETINPQLETGEEPDDFQDSGQFELFSLCCAYQPAPDANIEHEVFIRDDRGPESELELIDESLSLILSFSPTNHEGWGYQYGNRPRSQGELSSKTGFVDSSALLYPLF